MKIENNIGWCDATVNALTGCDKVSPGCKNCYAESGTRARVLRAQGRETWGANGERVPVNFEPVFRRLNKLCVCDNCHEGQRWLDDDGRLKNYQCFACGAFALRRIRLFADSNSDWLDPKWPVKTLARFLDAIRLAPNVDVMLLTKRIGEFDSRLAAVASWYAELECRDEAACQWVWKWLSGEPPSHVWLGVSAEDQKRADERIPALLKTPAAVRFLSVEPLLEPIDFPHAAPCGYYCDHDEFGGGHRPGHGLSGIDWVIVGGESGKDRRDCGVEAIVNVAEQCVSAGVPVYVKQDSAFLSGQQGRIPDEIWRLKQFPCKPLNH